MAPELGRLAARARFWHGRFRDAASATDPPTAPPLWRPYLHKGTTAARHRPLTGWASVEKEMLVHVLRVRCFAGRTLWTALGNATRVAELNCGIATRHESISLSRGRRPWSAFPSPEDRIQKPTSRLAALEVKSQIDPFRRSLATSAPRLGVCRNAGRNTSRLLRKRLVFLFGSDERTSGEMVEESVAHWGHLGHGQLRSRRHQSFRRGVMGNRARISPREPHAGAYSRCHS